MKAETAAKCQEIILQIVELCNNKRQSPTNLDVAAVGFFPDWGGMSLTVATEETHAHIGNTDGSSTFEDLVDSLHTFLHRKDV